MYFVFSFVVIQSFCLGYPEREEKSMRDRLLKCKDVVDVSVAIPDCFEEVKADICIYLTNGRYLKFGCVDYKMKKPEMWFFTIGNINPRLCYYWGNEISGRAAILDDISYFFPRVKSVQDVINNYDEIYKFLSELNEIPEHYIKKYKFNPTESDKTDLSSDWNALESKAFYIVGTKQCKLFKQTKVNLE